MPKHSRSSRNVDGFYVRSAVDTGTSVFRTPADYRAFQALLCQALRQHSIKLVAYSLMPSHWQLVVGPVDPTRLRRALDGVIRAHATLSNPVVSEPIRSIDDLIRAARDVERDALHAGLVRRAQDWPWGSLAGRMDAVNPLPLLQAPFLETRTWCDYVNADWSGHVSERPRGLSGRLQGRQHGGCI